MLKVRSPLQFSLSKSPHLMIPISHANLIHFQAFQVPKGLQFRPNKFTHGRKPITVCRAVENITVDADDNSEESEEENGIVEDILDLKIEKFGKNSRRITAKIEVEAPLDAVWNVLTDYERLADFIPGLAVCQLLERRENGARLLQIGEQNLVFGLKFKARGIVDVVENELEILPIGIRRDIDFKMVEGDFEVFEGKWGIEQFEGGTGNQNFSIKKDFRTLLSYIVDVQPKKWLPVALVEGRLSREIQVNMTCVRSQALHTAYDTVSLL